MNVGVNRLVGFRIKSCGLDGLASRVDWQMGETDDRPCLPHHHLYPSIHPSSPLEKERLIFSSFVRRVCVDACCCARGHHQCLAFCLFVSVCLSICQSVSLPVSSSLPRSLVFSPVYMRNPNNMGDRQKLHPLSLLQSFGTLRQTPRS